MTDLLSVDEREDEQGPLGNVVSMGSILGKQGVQVRSEGGTRSQSTVHSQEAGRAGAR